ncbi:MAG: hypothetical protein ACI4XC_01040 [Eubacterium sp.]
MDFIKEWTFSVCIALIVSVLISLLLPSGTMGKYSKIVISLFIFLSLLLPVTKSDITFSLPDTDSLEIYEKQEEAYSQLIEAQIKEKLNSAGFSGLIIECETAVKSNDNDEIEIKKLQVYIPDEYSKDEIYNFIYDNLGMISEVYYIGE